MATELTVWRELAESERLEWATQVASLVHVDRTRRLIVAEGTCPRCSCSFAVTLAGDELVSEQLRSAGEHRNGVLDWQAEVMPFVLVCTCDGEHPGRPSTVKHGCGAAGRFVDRL